MKYLEETIKLLKHIKEKPEATQRDMVRELDVSLGKVNFLIRSLVQEGVIKLKRFKSSKNKKGYLYVLTPLGVKRRYALLHKYLDSKMKEYDILRQEIGQLRDEVTRINISNGR